MANNSNRMGDGRPARPKGEPAEDHPSGGGGDDPTGILESTIKKRIGKRARRSRTVAPGEDDSTRTYRYVPVRIFLNDGNDASSVELAVITLLNSLHIGIENAGKPEIGSWFKSLRGRTEVRVTPRELDYALGVVRNVILRRADGSRLDSDIAYVAAAAGLISAIANESSVAIQIGSILLLKFTDASGKPRLIVLQLTPREIAYIDEHPQVMKCPERLVDALAGGLKEFSVATAGTPSDPSSPRHTDN